MSEKVSIQFTGTAAKTIKSPSYIVAQELDARGCPIPGAYRIDWLHDFHDAEYTVEARL
jgi:hypothetical protein